jgi:hypothetical protein
MMLRGSPRRLSLVLTDEPMAICRLGPRDAPPAWATGGPWWSMTRTADELSVVCAEASVPSEVAASRGWRLLRFEGPLAGAHVSLFAVATYDTDYVLVPEAQRHAAIAALESAGHTISAGL